ncbi:hypothetical protein [Hyalangium rubrum]|uniref:Tissue inhibitor of metalloproteinase n=1 Tax=Hyalangium rubrum TaxID=3103134 RepID=A0ABU5HC02_9BACT|nr:hypothetical protein [Hyalangium sp. s54d21]MDY7230352.1 hypothetical protein [Hyalangium sp. s54d21]
MHLRWLLPLLFALAVLMPVRASACMCNIQDKPEEVVQRSEAIFRGRVVSITRTGRFTFGKWSSVPRVVRFEVITAWKGPAEAELAVGDSFPDGCGMPFQEGVEYIVFAAPRPSGGVLWTSMCHHTQEFSPTAEYVKYVEAHLPPLPLKPKGSSNESSCSSTGAHALPPVLLLIAGQLVLLSWRARRAATR